MTFLAQACLEQEDEEAIMAELAHWAEDDDLEHNRRLARSCQDWDDWAMHSEMHSTAATTTRLRLQLFATGSGGSSSSTSLEVTVKPNVPVTLHRCRSSRHRPPRTWQDDTTVRLPDPHGEMEVLLDDSSLMQKPPQPAPTGGGRGLNAAQVHARLKLGKQNQGPASAWSKTAPPPPPATPQHWTHDHDDPRPRR